MRRVWVFGLCLLVGVPVLGCTEDPAPTDVTVAWADNRRRAVQVTWKEDGDAPNKVAIEGVVTESPGWQKYTAVGEPNSVSIPVSAFPVDGNYRIVVTMGTTRGGSTSKAGLSPMFDTDGPTRPVVTTVRTGPNGALFVKWQPVTQPEDFTPGDPLDLPRGVQTFSTALGSPGEPVRSLGPPSTATQRLMRNLRPPYVFQISAANEWGSIWAGQVLADTTTVTARIPNRSAYGVQLVVRGFLLHRRVRCGSGRCTAHTTTTPGIPVILHARERASGSWRAVGKATTSAGGQYAIGTASPGTRQYRVVVPDTTGPSLALRGGHTPVTTTVTAARPIAYGFRGGSVKERGQPATAYLRFAPPVNSQALLQYWTGAVWRNAVWVPVRSGEASLTFGATVPGVRGYRFVVPDMMYAGHHVSGLRTGSMVLVTR